MIFSRPFKLFRLFGPFVFCLTVWAAEAPTIVLTEAGVRNLRLETHTAEYTAFEETLFAMGQVHEIPSSRSVLSTRVSGRVIELYAFEGDFVEAGQKVARIESRQSGSPPPSIDLFVPRSGLVVESHLLAGQPVEPEQELMDISDRSTLWAVAHVPETAFAAMRVGISARIRIPALGDGFTTSAAVRLGLESDPVSRSIPVVFILANPDGRLKPGMRCEFSIRLSERAAVLAVPNEAVQGDSVNRLVFVKSFDVPNAFVKLEVVTGSSNDRFTEVVSGLFEGDEVVTRGAYALNFAGGSSGISLKEALDAAHGHEHNEDGSEKEAAAQPSTAAASASEGVPAPSASPFLWAYAGISTVVSLVLAQNAWNARRFPKNGQEVSDAQ